MKIIGFFAFLSVANGFAPVRQSSQIEQVSSSFSLPLRSKDTTLNLNTSADKLRKLTKRFASERTSEEDPSQLAPQAVSTGYSQNPDLLLAIEEATQSALSLLPRDADIDLGFVFVSSIYDGQQSPTKIIPQILKNSDFFCDMEGQRRIIKKMIGCSAGGLIGGKATSEKLSTFENEGMAGVTITFCVLPDTEIDTFHLLDNDIPDDFSKITPKEWKNSVGMSHFAESDDIGEDPPTFMLLPAPSFQKDLDDFLSGMKYSFGPDANIFGALSSTVSSLSRAKLFRYDMSRPESIQTLTDGCLGIAMRGDIQWKVMVASGAKPVGGIYRIVSGEKSTIGSIQLDEIATEQLQLVEEEAGISNDNSDDDDEISEEELMDARKRMAQAYQKAVMPKPVLAEANFLMKTLSDDDQNFMRKFILVGLERVGGIGKSPSDLLRLAEGDGHRFTVYQVASAGMKDGSVTLPLGSVDVELGSRLRFFVRDGEFAKKEVEAIWTGYKKKDLETMFSSDKKHFQAAGCFTFPTLDRGQKLFGGKAGFESSAIADFAPDLPSIAGFFSNGVIAPLDEKDEQILVQGSASCYALLGSKSGRPVFSAAEAIAANEEKEKKARQYAERLAAEETENRDDFSSNVDDKPAPRSPDGEILVKKREIHSGRALTVSAVQWSVAEKTAKPSSTLEGFMWDKETEVDRLRERVPLSNLLSQVKLFDLDPTKPSPRDWIGSVKKASKDGFVVVPEIKRTEPLYGSLRKRYDVKKLAKQYSSGGAAAISVNCDKVLFGGSLEDVSEAREAITEAIREAANTDENAAVPPILASDLILYPYQLYKLRLAGADAANIIVGALTAKDLLYLTKIASSLKMSIVASVTSEVQIRALMKLSSGIDAISVSNRDLENFSFDESGRQVLDLLKSDAMKEFREKFPETFVFAEGRVGMIEMDDGDYLDHIKDAGAMGAIIGGGLSNIKNDIGEYLASLK